jgi:hypothetical protein
MTKSSPVGHVTLDGQVMTLAEFDKSTREMFAEALFIPNSMIADESLHNHKEWNLCDGPDGTTKEFGQSAAALSRKFDAKYGKKIQKANEQAERNARLARYAAQVDSGTEIQYEEDEDKLYRFQLAFAAARQGMDE